MKTIDIHTLKAMEIYGVLEHEVTFEMRQVAKQWNYYLNYGMTGSWKSMKDITPKK